MSEETGHEGYEKADTGAVVLDRFLWLLVGLTAAGSLAGFFLKSGIFGAGVLVGGVLSVVNYLWLKSSVRVLLSRAEDGVKPQFLAVRYVARYLTFGAVLVAIYLTDAFPMIAVLLGLAGFAFAIVLEGLRSIVMNFTRNEED
jgi:hypothetical protein